MVFSLVLSCKDSTLLWQYKSRHGQYINQWAGQVSMKLHLWILKFEFHITFMFHSLFFFGFFQLYKKILSSQAIQKQEASWIWPLGCSVCYMKQQEIHQVFSRPWNNAREYEYQSQDVQTNSPGNNLTYQECRHELKTMALCRPLQSTEPARS